MNSAAPADLRLTGLIESIQDDIKRHEDEIDHTQVGRRDVPPAHTYAWHEVRGMHAVLARVRAALQTQEEYVLACSERDRRQPTAGELECARHYDRCARCQSDRHDVAAIERDRDRLEQVRRIFAQRIQELCWALEDPECVLSLPQVRAALAKLAAEADREWRRDRRTPAPRGGTP